VQTEEVAVDLDDGVVDFFTSFKVEASLIFASQN